MGAVGVGLGGCGFALIVSCISSTAVLTSLAVSIRFGWLRTGWFGKFVLTVLLLLVFPPLFLRVIDCGKVQDGSGP